MSQDQTARRKIEHEGLMRAAELIDKLLGLMNRRYAQQHGWTSPEEEVISGQPGGGNGACRGGCRRGQIS